MKIVKIEAYYNVNSIELSIKLVYGWLDTFCLLAFLQNKLKRPSSKEGEKFLFESISWGISTLRSMKKLTNLTFYFATAMQKNLRSKQ